MAFQPKYKFTSRAYIAGIALVFWLLTAYYVPFFARLSVPLSGLFAFLLALDAFMLASQKKGITARREMAERFSNGDENPVQIALTNRYPMALNLVLTDELPEQLQERDFSIRLDLAPRQNKTATYSVRPVRRGVYSFGEIHLWVTTALGLIKKHYRIKQPQQVAVYPSFHQLKRLELLSFAEMKNLLGLKRIRHLGYNREFEQVKEYLIGDEIKHINWKATARKNRLMVNQFQDEKSQSVYCVVDMGRTMEMPFKGMSLLDYAINASLALSQIILKNDDKTGLITYNTKVHTYLPADKTHHQMNRMMETLYGQKTSFDESWLEPVYTLIRRKINHRSLLIFFINFESVYSLQRYLPLLLRLNRNHLLLLVNFKNTEIERISRTPAKNLEEVYRKTIAEDFLHEKRTFLRELRRYGIYTLFESPENIGIQTINKYLEIKARGVL